MSMPLAAPKISSRPIKARYATNGQEEKSSKIRSSPQIAKKAATDPVARPTASTDQPWASR